MNPRAGQAPVRALGQRVDQPVLRGVGKRLVDRSLSLLLLQAIMRSCSGLTCPTGSARPGAALCDSTNVEAVLLPEQGSTDHQKVLIADGVRPVVDRYIATDFLDIASRTI